MNINDVLAHAREMRFAGKSDDDLHQMLIVCGNHTGQHSDVYAANQIPHAVKMIHEELARRQRAKNHQEAIAEQQKLHQKAADQAAETKAEVIKVKASVDLVKTSVDELKRPRWIDWAILAASVIAAVAAVIALFR
jgi:sRNA-binding protein